MKIIASIEARCGSTRLPNKIMMDILGEPSLAMMIERIKHAKRLDDIVIATTDSTGDDIVENLCKSRGVNCYRGSENDVLDRVVKATESVKGDVIVELTGDCILMDPALIDHMVMEYEKACDVDYVSNIQSYTWPEGFDVQVFPYKNVKWVNDNITDPAVHEHVSLYFYEVAGRYKTRNIEWERTDLHRPDWHLSLDEINDFKVIKRIYEDLYSVNPLFTVADVVYYLDKNPEVKRMNESFVAKEVR